MNLLIQTIEGFVYDIPISWKYILLYSNEEYEINITAELCGIDFDANKYIYINNKYLNTTDKNFPLYVRKRKYIKKIRIQYKNEYIELCADTLQILKRSYIASHIRVIYIIDSQDLQNGIYSLLYQKYYPIHSDTFKIKISIACLVNLEITIDTQTDERIYVQLLNFTDLQNCRGALIEKSISNHIDKLA